MLPKSTYRPLLLAIALLLTLQATAQRISFRSFAANGITITGGFFPDVLEFEYLVINSATVRTIQINGVNDSRVVALAVDMPEGYDLSVWVSANNSLELSGSAESPTPTIPFQLRFAYSNPGYATTHTDIAAAKSAATEVPLGFTSATFPVSKRSAGLPPGPPPTPEHEGYTVPMARAFLFFYGTAGPANEGINVMAGMYETEIQINIEFSNYND